MIASDSLIRQIARHAATQDSNAIICCPIYAPVTALGEWVRSASSESLASMIGTSRSYPARAAIFEHTLLRPEYNHQDDCINFRADILKTTPDSEPTLCLRSTLEAAILASFCHCAHHPPQSECHCYNTLYSLPSFGPTKEVATQSSTKLRPPKRSQALLFLGSGQHFSLPPVA